MLLERDILQIKTNNLTVSQVEEQLSFFMNGLPFTEIRAAASVEKGIWRLSDEQQDYYIRAWEDYLTGEKDKQIAKFVPASGVASRMFKDLFAFLSKSEGIPATDFEKTFFEGIADFAFFEQLNAACKANEGKDIAGLIAAGRYKDVVSNLLDKKGLNYGSLPKGLLAFHDYPEGVRTAMEEHLAEGAMYAKDRDNQATIHFTVLQEYLPHFERLVEEKKTYLEQLFDIKYNVSFSSPHANTSTIAADMANAPLRDMNGRLVFRPGGHGALIHNLNALNADVVFVKNIDNVTPDHFRQPTVHYKKTLAGVLVSLQKRIFEYVRLIESGSYTHRQVEEMIYFLQNELCIKNPETKYLEDAELVLYIKSKLNRPLRVCGMVKNVGEPGGGPFLAVNPDGTVSPQILESTQIDMNDPDARKIFDQSSHFNPVDLVCAPKDVNGQQYHLPDYVDKNTGFITLKSKDGRDLKAYELPGLWNGSMSDWNTVFVEVPVETFNPVKTVNDLLRASGNEQ